MKQENAAKVAEADGKHLQEKPFGYAINLVMDYGNGRQVTVSGTLPLGAPLEDFNDELDKLRLATNRQAAFVILRDRQARLAAEKKMVEALKHMVEAYDKGIEDEMAHIKNAPETKFKGSEQLQSRYAQQIENLRSQATNFKIQKQQEILQHESEVKICETIIASVQAEIEDIDKLKG